MEKYPKQSQSLFQVYSDIMYGKSSKHSTEQCSEPSVFTAQQWVEVEVKDITEVDRAVISGKKSADVRYLVTGGHSVSSNIRLSLNRTSLES